MLYRDEDNSYKPTVMKFDGINWTVVGTPGFSAGVVMYTSIAIDGAGVPYVVYQDYANDKKATVMRYVP